MNILKKETFNNLLKTRGGINKILSSMRPYLKRTTSGIINRVNIPVNSDEYDEIFQELQINLWKAIKNYNANKGNPFPFLKKHLMLCSLDLTRNFIYKKKKVAIITNKLTEKISNYDIDVIENIINAVDRNISISSLSDKNKNNYIDFVENKVKLSNSSRSNLRIGIKNNELCFNRYFKQLASSSL